MQLGLVTYNLARDWSVETLIERCVETGFAGVELRTSHVAEIPESTEPVRLMRYYRALWQALTHDDGVTP